MQRLVASAVGTVVASAADIVADIAAASVVDTVAASVVDTAAFVVRTAAAPVAEFERHRLVATTVAATLVEAVQRVGLGNQPFVVECTVASAPARRSLPPGHKHSF